MMLYYNYCLLTEQDKNLMYLFAFVQYMQKIH